jgi:DNA-binding CsgD family transcriptional regulator
MNIRTEDLQAVMQLTYELSEFPAAAPEALQHCLDQLVLILGARNAFWIGAVRETPFQGDGMNGWRPRAVSYLHSDPHSDRLIAQLMTDQRKNVVDPQTHAMVALAGNTRAHLRGELVDNTTWQRSLLYNEVLRPGGVQDRLLGSHFLESSTNSDPLAESYIGLDRAPGDKPFGARERNILQLLLTSCPGFKRDLLRARGLIQATSPLSPRECMVLRFLLTDMSEKEIAAELGLTWRTTHQYVVAIQRKFGVRGRVGLMALWLQNLSTAGLPRNAKQP